MEEKKTISTKWECQCCGSLLDYDVDSNVSIETGGNICLTCIDEWYVKCSKCGDYVYRDSLEYHIC